MDNMQPRSLIPVCLLLACLLPAGCGGSSSADSSTPDGAVASTLHALGEGRPAVLWNSLSEARQAEVRKLLADAAAEIDPELWERSVALLGKGAKVARDKKAFVLAAKPIASLPVRPAPEDLDKSLSSLAGALETLAESETKTVDGLKQLDPAKFLAGTGAKTLGQFRIAARAMGEADPFRKLSQARVVLVDQREDSATVRIEYPGELPLVVSLAKVEGRWLPADLRPGEWDQTLATVRAKLDALVAWQKADKDRLIAKVKRVDKALDGLLAAKSQSEFDEALEELSNAGK